MSDEPDNLVLQHLRAICAEMGKVSGALDTLGAEMRPCGSSWQAS